MGKNRQSDPDEKDLGRITPLPMAKIILDILRNHADKDGRVVCEPSFMDFLRSKLKDHGYSEPRYRISADKYNQSMAILYRYRLARRVSGKNGKSPAVFFVDLTTSYNQAQDIDKQLQGFLCKDLLSVIDNVTTETVLGLRADAIMLAQSEAREALIAEQTQTITEQAGEIERLGALVKDTLQDADKFIKNTRKRLRQA